MDAGEGLRLAPSIPHGGACLARSGRVDVTGGAGEA